MSDTECWDTVRENVELLHKHGVFASFIELLSIETENAAAATSPQFIERLSLCVLLLYKSVIFMLCNLLPQEQNMTII